MTKSIDRENVCCYGSSMMIGTTDAAKRLGISPMRVRQLVEAGRLPAQKIGRTWVVDERDLERVRDRKPGRPASADVGKVKGRGKRSG